MFGEFIILIMAFFGTTSIPGTASALVVFIGACTALFVYGRKAIRKVRCGWQKIDTLYEGVAGSDAIVDPQTGKELRPAMESMPVRVARMEETMATLANLLKGQHELDARLATLMEKKDEEHQRIWDAIEGLNPPKTADNVVTTTTETTTTSV